MLLKEACWKEQLIKQIQSSADPYVCMGFQNTQARRTTRIYCECHRFSYIATSKTLYNPIETVRQKQLTPYTQLKTYYWNPKKH